MHSPIKLFSYTFINSFIFYQFMYSQHHIWSLIRFSFSFIHSLFHQFNHPFTVEAAIALNVWVGGCKIKNQGYFWHTHPPPFGQHPRRGRWPIERRIFSIFFVFLHPPGGSKGPTAGSETLPAGSWGHPSWLGGPPGWIWSPPSWFEGTLNCSWDPPSWFWGPPISEDSLEALIPYGAPAPLLQTNSSISFHSWILFLHRG